MDALTIRDFRLTWVGIRVAVQCGSNPPESAALRAAAFSPNRIFLEWSSP
jgi:hypothetical protein